MSLPRKNRVSGNRHPANGTHFVALLVGAELPDVAAYQKEVGMLGVLIKHHWRPADGCGFAVPDEVDVVLLMRSPSALVEMRQRSAFIWREMPRRAIFDAQSPAKAVDELAKAGFCAPPIAGPRAVVIEPPEPPAPPAPLPMPEVLAPVVVEPEPEPEPEPPVLASVPLHTTEKKEAVMEKAERVEAGKAIREARKAHGYSAIDFGDAVGLTKSQVFNLEAGAQSIAPQFATKIEKRLKLAPGTVPRSEPGAVRRGRPPAPRLARGTSPGLLGLAPKEPVQTDASLPSLPSEGAVVAFMRIRAMLAALDDVSDVEIKALVGGHEFTISGDKLSVERRG